jgi:hypothetical protein
VLSLLTLLREAYLLWVNKHKIQKPLPQMDHRSMQYWRKAGALHTRIIQVPALLHHLWCCHHNLPWIMCHRTLQPQRWSLCPRPQAPHPRRSPGEPQLLMHWILRPVQEAWALLLSLTNLLRAQVPLHQGEQELNTAYLNQRYILMYYMICISCYCR